MQSLQPILTNLNTLGMFPVTRRSIKGYCVEIKVEDEVLGTTHQREAIGYDGANAQMKFQESEYDKDNLGWDSIIPVGLESKVPGLDTLALPIALLALVWNVGVLLYAFPISSSVACMRPHTNE